MALTMQRITAFKSSSSSLSIVHRFNLDRFERFYGTTAYDSFRPRNTPARMQRLAENYMYKMQQKYGLRTKKRLKPKGVHFSKGVPPSLLSDVDEGLKGVLRHRQRVLDKIFMENLTEILSTNPIGEFLKEMDVLITQTEITKDYHILHVYYYCDSTKAKTVLSELIKIKERLRFLLTQKYIMGKVPTIEYIYDLSYDSESKLAERLDSLDLGPQEEHQRVEVGQEFSPPKPDPEPFKPLGTRRRAKALTTFDPNFANYSTNPYENTKAPQRFLVFEYPDDMRLDMFSLDYKNIANKILFNLSKTRSPSQSFNPISDPLPPVDWSSVKPMPRLPPDMNDPAQNFKGRVVMMNKFLIENRKKKQLLAREAKRIKEQMSLEASETLNQALDNIGFTDFYEETGNIESHEDYEYLHSKLDEEENI
ncbi:uncharacterized protein LOC107368293 [Tetranychus urticae]|uniref:Ribosome-binding factor A, mitochondrial n=1 Tax=Tetranychus urticae TaxID=32264 RepID=T1KXX7_TETUR|nr:uncharacterized protein LOC107368293 [Tetranychus urticae]